PRSMMKAVSPFCLRSGEVEASTTYTPATEPCVMKVLVPDSTHPEPRRWAVVRAAPASLPEPGSVSPQAPSIWPLASGGRHLGVWPVRPRRKVVPAAQRVVKRAGEANAAVGAARLSQARHVGEHRHAGTAVLLGHAHTPQPHLAELGHNLVRELFGLIPAPPV